MTNKKKWKRFYCFIIEVNTTLHAEQVQAGTFRAALKLLPKKYKSFKSVTWVGVGNELSEAIMVCVDYLETKQVKL
jgi:hypothetical protein